MIKLKILNGEIIPDYLSGALIRSSWEKGQWRLYTGSGQGNMKTEMGVMQLQAKECHTHQKLEEARSKLPLELLWTQPLCHLNVSSLKPPSVFWPLELGENRFLLFKPPSLPWFLTAASGNEYKPRQWQGCVKCYEREKWIGVTRDPDLWREKRAGNASSRHDSSLSLISMA